MTTREVSSITGLSLRRLQLWVEAGLISLDSERKQGCARAWTPENALRVMVLSQLAQCGYRPQRLRRIADMMPLSLMERRFVVSDGRNVWACGQEAEAVAFGSAAQAPVVIIHLAPLIHAAKSAQPRASGMTA